MDKHFKFLKKPIKGLDDDICMKRHDILKARWDYFHKPIFTCAYHFEPKFAHAELDTKEGAEMEKYLRTVHPSDTDFLDVCVCLCVYTCVCVHTRALVNLSDKGARGGF